MPDLSVSQRQYVETTYATAQNRIEALERANDRRESDQRQRFIDELVAHQGQIADLQFFTRQDFTAAEQDALLGAADGIQQLIADIDDINDLTMTSVGTDLASTIQGISLDEYQWALNLTWIGARRHNRLPRDIPDDVHDAFCLYLFSLIQGHFNWFAERAREIYEEGCLNPDDYSETFIRRTTTNTATASAKLAVDDHIAMQRLQAAAREAERQRKEESLGVGGQIWAVIGWDSPWDFIVDVGLTAVFGGASAVRWLNRIKKAKDRVAKAKKLTENVERIRKTVQTAEKRLDTIRDAAAKIRKAKALSEIPAKITAAFKRLEKAEEQIRELEKIRQAVPGNYFRTAVSGAAANLVADRRAIGGQLTEEVARKAIIDWINGTALGQQIERRRSIINVKSLLSRQLSPTGSRMLHEYITLVWMQQVIVRMGVAQIVHKRPLTAQATVEHLIGAAGAAAEQILLDLKVIPDQVVKVVTRGVLTFVRKVLFEFLQVVAREIMK